MEVDKRKECVWGGGGGGDKESHCNILKVRANIPQKGVTFHPAQCPIDGLTHNEGYVIYSQHVWSAQICTDKCYRPKPAPPTLVKFVPVDDEAGRQVGYTLVVVIAISFSVFFITYELWEGTEEGCVKVERLRGEQYRERDIIQRLHTMTCTHAHTHTHTQAWTY